MQLNWSNWKKKFEKILEKILEKIMHLEGRIALTFGQELQISVQTGM